MCSWSLQCNGQHVAVFWFAVQFQKLPYSGKFSREKINFFANFANYRLFVKILSANVLFFVQKDRAIALIRENIICEMLYLVHSRKNFAIRYLATNRLLLQTRTKELYNVHDTLFFKFGSKSEFKCVHDFI